MDYKEKQKELVAEFEKNQQAIIQLNNRNQQIVGQIQILTELEKEQKPKEKTEGDKNNGTS
jgi:hypothetical protein